MASYAATFKNIQDAVIARVRLDATNDLTAVKSWINQGYARLCVECEANITSGTFPYVAGTATYTLSSLLSGNVARIKQVYSAAGNVVSNPLRQVSLDEILRRRVAGGGSAVATGAPWAYALSGLNDLEFFPTPATADTVTVYYVTLPTLLSADGDVHILGEPWSEVLEDYACSRAADYKGDPMVEEYRSLFLDGQRRFTAHLNRRRGGQPGRMGVYPPGPFVPHDPSTDTGSWY